MSWNKSCNSEAGILFYLCYFFEFLKKIHIKKCQSAYSTLGTNTLPGKPGLTVIKLSVFLKITPTQISESDNTLCPGNILRRKYVLVKNTLSFSDHTLGCLMWESYVTEEPKSPPQTNDCFPEF
jgi:hypothetical protein